MRKLKQLLMGTAIIAVLAAAALPTKAADLSDVSQALIFIMFDGEAAPPAFSFRATYDNTGNATTHSFASSDLGTSHSKRLVHVAVFGTSSVSLTSVTVAGVAATRTASGSTNARRCELWQCALGIGSTTGTIDVAWGSSNGGCRIGVWVGYPASATAQTAVHQESSSSTSDTHSNITTTAGGYAIALGRKGETARTSTVTDSGTETVTEHFDGDVDASYSANMSSYLSLDTTAATNDITVAFSGGTSGLASEVCTWGPP